MSRRHRLSASLAALALVGAGALGPGCADDAHPPRLRWAFGNGLRCDEAGVRYVHVFLGPLGPGSYDRQVRCQEGEDDGLLLFDVAAGPHPFVLKGLSLADDDSVEMTYFLAGEIVIPDGNGTLERVLAPRGP